VDSAETTATALQTMLERERLCATGETGGVRLLATDERQRFARVGALFLDHALDPDEIELVDLSPPA
jgi:glutamate racemase